MPDIFEQLLAETRAAEHAAVASASRWFHRGAAPPPHTSAAPAAALPAPRGEPPMPNVLTALHDAIAEGVTNVRGWTDSLEGQLTELATTAEKYKNSPIVAALDQLGDAILPPDVEQGIASMIAHWAPPPTADAEPTPAPATPADTTPAPVPA